MSFPFAATGVLATDMLGAAAKPAVPAKLTNAAQEFEATMMQELLKPMRGGSDDGDEDDAGSLDGAASTDAGKDTLMGLGTQAMAEAIARGGGFGIASRVIAEVGRDQQRVARMNKR